jgi:hypothetical protein
MDQLSKKQLQALSKMQQLYDNNTDITMYLNCFSADDIKQHIRDMTGWEDKWITMCIRHGKMNAKTKENDQQPKKKSRKRKKTSLIPNIPPTMTNIKERADALRVFLEPKKFKSLVKQAFEIAIRNEDVPLIEFCLNNGSTIEHGLHYSVQYGTLQLIHYFMDKGASLEQNDLLNAIRANQPGHVKWLLDRDEFDINSEITMNGKRITPLIHSVSFWYMEPTMVALLLEKGADVTQRQNGAIIQLLHQSYNSYMTKSKRIFHLLLSHYETHYPQIDLKRIIRNEIHYNRIHDNRMRTFLLMYIQQQQEKK